MVVQFLYSWRIEPSILGTIFIMISVIILGCNVFFIIRLSSHISDKLLKGFNSYLLISTFIFYLSYCLKASLITTNPLVLETPFILELILLITLIFNSYQIFIYSREIKKREKQTGKKKKRLLNELFSWIDALLSAVIFVLLINLFLIQIYSIPSESMFPVFFIKDRPVVDKITRGPELPFTRFRIPPIQKIKRGDIVTFRNPRYENTVESEIKHLFSQFIYMITFTGINIDKYDDFGNIKADPLVKRVVALPGEQIQIINDRVYIRSNLNREFKLQEEEIHSAIDLYSLDNDTLKKLVNHKIDKDMRDILNRLDHDIENLNRVQIIQQNQETFHKAQSIRARLLAEHPNAIKNGLEKQYESLNKRNTSLSKTYSPFQKIEYFGDDNLHYFYNIEDDEIWDQGWAFLTSVIPANTIQDFNLIASNTDLLYKKIVIDWILINLEYLEKIIIENNNVSELIENKLIKNEKSLGEFITYILRYYDFRNLPPFPENDLIEEDHYFLMGDNRYNSKDLRHGLHPQDRFFINDQEQAFVYKSLLNPTTVNESRIEGFVLFRLFPINRIGIPDK